MSDANRRWRHIQRAVYTAVVLSALSLLISVVGSIAGITSLSRTQEDVDRQALAAAQVAREACVRAKVLGPLNYREHVLIGVYDDGDLRYFRRTIPKDCD